MTATPPTASVIVCTRNRADLLEGSLMRLVEQTPSVSWQLVVVDNASTDHTAAVVEHCHRAAGGLWLNYVVEERLGLSHARNRGIAAAKGRYLLFTDDDVLVEPGWVDALCAAFSEEEVVGVAGRVVPAWPKTPPRWLAGLQTGVLAVTDLGDEIRCLSADEIPMGANMAIRASLLSGWPEPFDPRLGHKGRTFFAFEEAQLFHVLRQRGRLAYRPDAVVRHRIAPERMTWRGMRRATLQNGFGSRRADRLRGVDGVPLRVAVPALMRFALSAMHHTWRNGSRDDLEPEAAFEELRAYWGLGRWIEVVFGNSRLGGWLVTRLA